MLLKTLLLLFLLAELSFSLVIGTVTDKPSKRYTEYREFALYLQKKLGEDVDVIFLKSIPHMKSLIGKGEVDVFIDSLYPSLKVCMDGECEPLLLIWRNGVRYYRSVVIVRSDSPIRDAKDLTGKRIAFEEPFSTAGYLVPFIMLRDRGLRLVELRSFHDPVPPGYVGYVFADEEENIVGWVFFGKTSAGALYDLKFDRIVGRNRKFFREILISSPIPQQLVSFSRKLGEDKVRKILKILRDMHNDPEGKEVLKSFSNTTKFEDLSDYDRKIIESLKKKMRELGL